MDRLYMSAGGSSSATDIHSFTFGGSSSAVDKHYITFGGSSLMRNRQYITPGCSPSVNMYSWYFTKQEIEWNSPSRKDGIDLQLEENLRRLYCSFIRDAGIRLGLPQLTIATAMLFCHRFYLHQSHSKNGWETIATACIFLASKVEDTIVTLDEVIRVSYETMSRRDPSATWQIYQKDVFKRQKELILIAERLLLTTIRFDFNVQHPYRPLLDAMKRLGIIQVDVRQAAWNFVNHWIQTTMCLQYEPHYIAAGSLYLAAEVNNLRLPMGKEYMWWHQFGVNPTLLGDVIQQMSEMLGIRQIPISLGKKPLFALEDGNRAPLMYYSPDSVLSGLHLS